MNAIRNYLDNMFRNLPNTEEVRKAKSELLQMMEDKYEELIAEGKTENEAVGIVISEFGNLDELAESLGISEAVAENSEESKPMLSMERINEYLAMNNQRSILMPLGIALCIFSVAFNIIVDAIPELSSLEPLGVSAMFMAIAGAVALFIVSGIKKKEFAEVFDKECSLSIESAEYVRVERKSFKSSYGLVSSVGIGLCILSVVNPIVIGSIRFINDDFGAVMFLLFIALGVFLITSANSKMNGYDRLLELNETGRMSEEFVPKADRKVNKTPIIICAVAAVVIAVVVFGINIAGSFISYTTLRDYGNVETMATTYEINKNNDPDSELDSIKIDLNACKINVKTAEGTGLISADYSGPKTLKPEVLLENGKLIINQQGGDFRFIGIHFDDPELEIVIGEDVDLSSFEMDINAGDIRLDGINADYLFADIDAGNVEINGCTFRKADFDVDAGNFNIKDSLFKILNIDTDAGNVEIDGTGIESVKIDVNFGSVDIDDLGDIDSYDIECEVDAGVIEVGGHTSGRSYDSKGSGAGTIEINVDAGSINIS